MLKTAVTIGTLMLAASAPVHAAIQSVPATADLWLAGMSAGATASIEDSAPGQSPILVTGISFAAGDRLLFSATGSTDHCTGGVCGLAGPEGDGAEAASGHATGAENGIGNIFSPIDALIGVFLDAGDPSASAAPSGILDFTTLASRDFALLAPLLKQPFFIGDGLRNDGVTAQLFEVPTGATRLFLGTMDGYGWWNNVGSLRVNASVQGSAPEPGSLLLTGLALAAVAISRRRRG